MLISLTILGVLRQLKGVGEGSLKTLIAAGISSFTLLEETDPRDLERFFRRNPPFGNNMLADLASFPKFFLRAERTREHIEVGRGVTLSFKIAIGTLKKTTYKKKNSQPHFVDFIVDTDTGSLIDFRRQLYGSESILRR